jgi:hypothetical protein
MCDFFKKISEHFKFICTMCIHKVHVLVLLSSLFFYLCFIIHLNQNIISNI